MTSPDITINLTAIQTALAVIVAVPSGVGAIALVLWKWHRPRVEELVDKRIDETRAWTAEQLKVVSERENECQRDLKERVEANQKAVKDRLDELAEQVGWIYRHLAEKARNGG